MEKNDRETILKTLKSNIQLKRLYEQHLAIEQKLTRLGNRTFLTPSEEMESKRLKKVKLHGVDRMMSMISESSLSL